MTFGDDKEETIKIVDTWVEALNTHELDETEVATAAIEIKNQRKKLP